VAAPAQTTSDIRACDLERRHAGVGGIEIRRQLADEVFRRFGKAERVAGLLIGLDRLRSRAILISPKPSLDG
jgi:hypothetical protein